jgi:hypothetical protein
MTQREPTGRRERAGVPQLELGQQHQWTAGRTGRAAGRSDVLADE